MMAWKETRVHGVFLRRPVQMYGVCDGKRRPACSTRRHPVRRHMRSRRMGRGKGGGGGGGGGGG